MHRVDRPKALKIKKKIAWNKIENFSRPKKTHQMKISHYSKVTYQRLCRHLMLQMEKKLETKG